MYELGSRLRELRKQQGFTQKALARRINKSKSAIASYESDRQMPPLEVLISIASVLNVSLDYMVGFEKHIAHWEGLSEAQISIINQIVEEFRASTEKQSAFSQKQVEIMMRLAVIFQSNE